MTRFYCKIETAARIPDMIPDLTLRSREDGGVRYVYICRNRLRYDRIRALMNASKMTISRISAVATGRAR